MTRDMSSVPRFRYRRMARIAVPLGAAGATAVVGIAAYTARVINTAPKRTWRNDYVFTPWELQAPHEPVEFVAPDGVTLRGWWLANAESDKVIVCCTGHRGAKHELLGIGTALWRAGNTVLLFDFRGCGDSDPAPISLGHHEEQDVEAALTFARRRMPTARLGIVGYSMGGAIAILVAAFDTSIEVVVADSAFANIQGVIAFAYQHYRLPSGPITKVTDWITRWRYGYPFSAVRPVDAVARIAPRPLLIIHGGRDAVTPVDHAYQLFSAAGEPKELWIIPEARHCGAYFVDRQLYVERVAGFLADAFEGHPAAESA